MILPIYLYGQPVLRKPTEDVTPELLTPELLSDMWETLAVAEGCGLAAPQIGKSIRLFIVDGTELAEDYPECQDFKKVFINPEIVEESEDTTTFSEGCLSLPGISRMSFVLHLSRFAIWMRTLPSIPRPTMVLLLVLFSTSTTTLRRMSSPTVSRLSAVSL